MGGFPGQQVPHCPKLANNHVLLKRRVLGIIGLCYCPDVADMNAAYRQVKHSKEKMNSKLFLQFQGIVGSHPDVRQSRCIAFNPTSTPIDHREWTNFHMFPSAELDESFGHIQNLMFDFCGALVSELETLALSADTPLVQIFF